MHLKFPLDCECQFNKTTFIFFKNTLPPTFLGSSWLENAVFFWCNLPKKKTPKKHLTWNKGKFGIFSFYSSGTHEPTGNLQVLVIKTFFTDTSGNHVLKMEGSQAQLWKEKRNNDNTCFHSSAFLTDTHRRCQSFINLLNYSLPALPHLQFLLSSPSHSRSSPTLLALWSERRLSYLKLAF